MTLEELAHQRDIWRYQVAQDILEVIWDECDMNPNSGDTGPALSMANYFRNHDAMPNGNWNWKKWLKEESKPFIDELLLKTDIELIALWRDYNSGLYSNTLTPEFKALIGNGL